MNLNSLGISATVTVMNTVIGEEMSLPGYLKVEFNEIRTTKEIAAGVTTGILPVTVTSSILKLEEVPILTKIHLMYKVDWLAAPGGSVSPAPEARPQLPAAASV